MTSIKDIANQLNVSVSTVSYALRGDTKISEKTRLRVQEAAKRMNYVPNTVARVMQGQGSRIIGVLIHDYGGHFFGDVLQGIRSELEKNGYEMVVSSSISSFRLLLYNFFEAAIILSQDVNEKDIENFIASNHRIVLMDRIMNHDMISCVTIDNEQGVDIAMEKLVAAKHQKMYVLTGPKHNYDARVRLQRVHELMQVSALNIEIIEGDFSFDSGHRFATAYQVESQDCGILCLNDEMAIGVYQAIQEKSIIGKSLSIIGFDNIEILSYLTPRISSIGVDRHAWGRMSAKAILQLLKGEMKGIIKIKVNLNEGNSIRKQN